MLALLLLLEGALAGPTDLGVAGSASGWLCGTPAALRPGPRLDPMPPPPPGPDKLERDPYETPNSLSSDNFVLRWGDDPGVGEGQLQALLGYLEEGWTEFIDEHDFPLPPGADTYKVNAWIADSGDGAPSGLSGAAGYHTTDNQGYSVLVFDQDVVTRPGPARRTAVHELFHAVQQGSGSFPHEGLQHPHSWFWEGTASWSEALVYPEDDAIAELLFAYALTPHLAIETFDRDDYSFLVAIRGYGTSIWAQYLSEHVGGVELLRRLWVEGGSDPMEGAAVLLAEGGLELHEVFADFAITNATWDYAEGERYEEIVQDGESYATEGEEAEVGLWVRSSGSEDWESPELAMLPSAHGYSIAALSGAARGPMRVAVRGEEEGSAGGAADWRFMLAVEEGEGWVVYSVPTEAGVGELTVEVAERGAAVRVAAVPWTQDPYEEEWFEWAVRIEPSEEADPDGDGGGGGGEEETSTGCCAERGQPGDWRNAGLFLLLGVGWARRRHADRAVTAGPPAAPGGLWRRRSP